jgi:hypothetical protein
MHVCYKVHGEQNYHFVPLLISCIFALVTFDTMALSCATSLQWFSLPILSLLWVDYKKQNCETS